MLENWNNTPNQEEANANAIKIMNDALSTFYASSTGQMCTLIHEANNVINIHHLLDRNDFHIGDINSYMPEHIRESHLCPTTVDTASLLKEWLARCSAQPKH